MSKKKFFCANLISTSCLLSFAICTDSEAMLPHPSMFSPTLAAYDHLSADIDFLRFAPQGFDRNQPITLVTLVELVNFSIITIVNTITGVCADLSESPRNPEGLLVIDDLRRLLEQDPREPFGSPSSERNVIHALRKHLWHIKNAMEIICFDHDSRRYFESFDRAARGIPNVQPGTKAIDLVGFFEQRQHLVQLTREIIIDENNPDNVATFTMIFLLDILSATQEAIFGISPHRNREFNIDILTLSIALRDDIPVFCVQKDGKACQTCDKYALLPIHLRTYSPQIELGPAVASFYSLGEEDVRAKFPNGFRTTILQPVKQLVANDATAAVMPKVQEENQKTLLEMQKMACKNFELVNKLRRLQGKGPLPQKQFVLPVENSKKELDALYKRNSKLQIDIDKFEKKNARAKKVTTPPPPKNPPRIEGEQPSTEPQIEDEEYEALRQKARQVEQQRARQVSLDERQREEAIDLLRVLESGPFVRDDTEAAIRAIVLRFANANAGISSEVPKIASSALHQFRLARSKAKKGLIDFTAVGYVALMTELSNMRGFSPAKIAEIVIPYIGYLLEKTSQLHEDVTNYISFRDKLKDRVYTIERVFGTNILRAFPSDRNLYEWLSGVRELWDDLCTIKKPTLTQEMLLPHVLSLRDNLKYFFPTGYSKEEFDAGAEKMEEIHEDCLAVFRIVDYAVTPSAPPSDAI